MDNAKYPVLDNGLRDAEIIGYATTDVEAEAIFVSHLKEAGCEADEMPPTTMNFRTDVEGYERSEFLDVAELENGFFDPL